VILGTSGQDPEHKPITEFSDWKKGRPLTLLEEILSILKKYIYAICDAGEIVNTSIVIATRLGIVKKGILENKEGCIVLEKKLG